MEGQLEDSGVWVKRVLDELGLNSLKMRARKVLVKQKKVKELQGLVCAGLKFR